MPRMGLLESQRTISARKTAKAVQGTAGAVGGVSERLDRIGPILDGMARQQVETNRLLAEILVELRRRP
jgi:hypothetical protein